MGNDYIQGLFAKRLGGDSFGTDTKIYKFEKIKRAKLAARAANPGKELFDFGVGEFYPLRHGFARGKTSHDSVTIRPPRRGGYGPKQAALPVVSGRVRCD